MEDKELREGGPPTTYDNTMRGTYRSCPRKMYWFLRGLDYEQTPSYFTFGKVWQIVLDAWYSPQTDSTMGTDAIYAHGMRALEVGRKAWDDEGCVGSRNDTWENLELLFKHYIGQYPTEPFRVVGTEKGWEWPLAGTPYFLGGSLDGYIEWEGYGLLVMENKTSGVYLTDQYIRQWNFANQITQYIWFLTRFLGKEIFGCLMNMATKRIPKKKAPDSLFARDLQKRSSWELEQFEEDILLDIKDIEREWERWIWPKSGNPIECVGGIGKAPCLFQSLCSVDAKPWEIDPMNYQGLIWRKEKWEPWKRG